MMTLTASADRIWTILVEECGAREDGREDFLRLFPGCREYRFMGALGFGGKVYANGRYSDGAVARVGCYREDQTPERLQSIRRANDRILALSWDNETSEHEGSS